MSELPKAIQETLVAIRELSHQATVANIAEFLGISNNATSGRLFRSKDYIEKKGRIYWEKPRRISEDQASMTFKNREELRFWEQVCVAFVASSNAIHSSQMRKWADAAVEARREEKLWVALE